MKAIITLLAMISLSACSQAPYYEFNSVKNGRYLISLNVVDEVSGYGEHGEIHGVHTKKAGLHIIQSKNDFCTIVHELAHVFYGHYHDDFYYECERKRNYSKT